MKTTVPNRASGEHKKIIMIILIIIALVAIIAALIFNLTGKNKNKADGETQTFAETDSGLQTKEPLDSSTGNNETGAPVAEDTQTQIEALILKYRTAFANGDIEALKNVYNTNDVMNSEVIAATSKIITGYENTACYIKDGMDSTSKVVFIYDDLKIDGIDTRIPNVAYVYVKQKDDGSYYIYPGEYDKATSDYVYSSDIQKYISELIKDEEINSLYASVNEKMSKAMNDDPQVKNFVQKLTAGEADSAGSTAETKENTGVPESSQTQDTGASEPGTDATDSSITDSDAQTDSI